jgi:hypothetical protein
MEPEGSWQCSQEPATSLPTKTLYTFLFSPLRAVFPAHLVLIELIVLTLSGEEHKFRSSPLRNLLHLHYFIHLGPKYSPQHPVLKRLQSVLVP